MGRRSFRGVGARFKPGRRSLPAVAGRAGLNRPFTDGDAYHAILLSDETLARFIAEGAPTPLKLRLPCGDTP